MSLKRIACRLLVVYTAVTVLILAGGSTYASAWLRPVGLVFERLCPFVEVLDVQTIATGGEHFLRLRGITREPLVLPEGTIPVGTEMTTATLRGYLFVHLVLIACALAAWPCSTRSCRMKLAIAAVPAVALATMLDIPFVLAGAARAEVVPALGGGQDILVSYYRFVETGGRPFLSLLVAALAILTSRQRPAADS